MRARTEDLLKILDGEPVDAALRKRILADPECMRELERLRRVRQGLRDLPPLEPPPGVWERVRDQVQAQSCARTRRSFFSPRRWPAAAAAALLAGAAFWIVMQPPERAPRPAEPPAAAVAEVARARSGDWAGLSSDYAWLVAESMRLERLLAALPDEPRTMTADTAGTIAALEDRVAWLDEQLSTAAARDWAPQRRQVLWNERVEVMNALLQVRYAQAPYLRLPDEV